VRSSAGDLQLHLNVGQAVDDQMRSANPKREASTMGQDDFEDRSRGVRGALSELMARVERQVDRMTCAELERDLVWELPEAS
jgi:hypothetical protein